MRRLLFAHFVIVATLVAGCGSPSTSPPPAPTCAEYCDLVQTTCAPDHQQYSDMDDCLASCVAFPVGTGTDMTGDTLGCRLTYARAAGSSVGALAANCAYAGPGGDGRCGANCEGYCDLAMMYCSAEHAAKLYDTRADCMADCAKRTDDTPLSAGAGVRTDMGNTTACLLYHAQMGSVAPSGHCLGDLAIVGGACQ
jgi:hypothetical protein